MAKAKLVYVPTDIRERIEGFERKYGYTTHEIAEQWRHGELFIDSPETRYWMYWSYAIVGNWQCHLGSIEQDFERWKRTLADGGDKPYPRFQIEFHFKSDYLPAPEPSNDWLDWLDMNEGNL